MEDSFHFRIIIKSEQLSPEKIEYCFNNMIFFKPTYMRGMHSTSHKLVRYNAKKFSDMIKLEGMNDEFKAELRVKNGNEDFSIIKGSYGKSLTWISCSLCKATYEKYKTKILEFVDMCMISFDGIVAHAESSLDSFWQNAEEVGYYTGYGNSIEGIKLIPDKSRHNVQIVDIEENEGHQHIRSGIWFGSSWTMWFGNAYSQYVDRLILERFNQGCDNRTLINGTVRIMLYENVWDYENPENRKVKLDFRNRLQIDRIAHEIERKPLEVEEFEPPVVEIFRGGFDHGGTLLVKYYFNDKKKPCRKDRASLCRIVEQSKDGQILWESIEKLY